MKVIRWFGRYLKRVLRALLNMKCGDDCKGKA